MLNKNIFLFNNLFFLRLLMNLGLFALALLAVGFNFVLISLWIGSNFVIYLFTHNALPDVRELFSRNWRDVIFLFFYSFLIVFLAQIEMQSYYLGTKAYRFSILQVGWLSLLLSLLWSISSLLFYGLLVRIEYLRKKIVFFQALLLSVSGLIVLLLFYFVLYPFLSSHDYTISMGALIKFSVAFFILPHLLFPALQLIEQGWIFAAAAQRREVTLVIASALLTALSFPQADLPLLRGFPLWPWFSLIPFFYYLQQKRSLQARVSLIYLWEFFYTIFLLWWIHDFADLGPPFLALVLPVYRIAPLLLAEWIADHLPSGAKQSRIFLQAAGFMLGDALRSFGYLAFPWGFMAYTQIDFTPLAMLSRFGGIWLISFFIIMHNTTLAYMLPQYQSESVKMGERIRSWLLQKSSVHLIYYSFLAIVAGATLYFSTQIPAKDPQINKGENVKKFIVVQPAFDPWGGWFRHRNRYFKILKYWTDQGMQEKDVDFILWTESSTLERFTLYAKRNRTNPFQQNFKALIRTYQRPLLTGAVDAVPYVRNNRVGLDDYNAATLFDKDANIVSTYRKNQLVPFGEWFPYEDLIPGSRAILDSYGGSTWTPGKELKTMELEETGRFGTLICYEGIFFRLVRDYVNLGANYLINVTNLMWTQSYAGHIQHASMSQMRAMEQNRYFVRSANDGLSCSIDPYGRILKSIPLFKRGVLHAAIDAAPREKTFYAHYGDWFLYLVLVIFVLFLFFAIYRRFSRAGSKLTTG